MAAIIYPNPDCSSFNYDYLLVGPCTDAVLTTAPLPPGTYWFFVAPQFTSDFWCTDYQATLTSTSGCTCDPVSDLTVLRETGPGNGVNLRWYAGQDFGFYNIYGTNNKNNDHDPDHGADPDWALVSAVPAPGAPGYVTYNDTPLQNYVNYVVEHDCRPRGRCCYGDPENPSCEVDVQEDCAVLGGIWSIGLNCTDNPCPILPHHDMCQNAEVISSFPYTDSDDNSGATSDCPSRGWAEVWYTFTTTQTCNLVVAECGTAWSSPNSTIVMDQTCPCTSTWVYATTWDNTSCGDLNWTIYWNNLPAGTYWYPIYSDVGSQGPYTVTFTCTP
jgi:hypothetical protein